MLPYLAFIFILGLVFGSFATVCIHRIPRGESVVTPRSRCPGCGKLIRWHDNIPVLGFLLLGRKCRSCGAPISWRYPLIELATGAAFLIVAWRHPFETVLPAYLAFTFLLIVISGIDHATQTIPDILSLCAFLLGIGSSLFDPGMGDEWRTRLLHSCIGAAAGGGALLLVGIIGSKLFRKDAMGGGDVKLMLGIGALLGWQQALSTIFLASCLGSAYGVTLILAKRIGRKEYIPFGPFLAFGAYVNIVLNGLWLY